MRKEVIWIVRFIIMNFLFAVGIIGFFGVPSDNLGMLAWISVLILSKIIGVVAFVLMFTVGDLWYGRFFENKGL